MRKRLVLLYIVVGFGFFVGCQALSTTITMKELIYTLSQESISCLMNSFKLHDSSLVEFIRLRRFPFVNLSSFYCSEPFKQEILQGLRDGTIPKSIINDLLRFRDFEVTEKARSFYFENLDVLELLNITESFRNLEKFTIAQRRILIELLVSRQCRKLYNDAFYGKLVEDLDDWVEDLVTENTWEFFDLNCLEHIKVYCSYNEFGGNLLAWNRHLIQLSEKLLPIASNNDLALFRLASLRILSPKLEKDLVPLESFFDKLRHSGTEIQRLILETINTLAKVSFAFPIKSFGQAIEIIYDHFFDYLTRQKNPSPAFLLELLYFSLGFTQSKIILDLLGDIVKNYPPERISPQLMLNILDWRLEAAHFRSTLPSHWNRIANDLTIQYYMPSCVWTKEETLKHWCRDVNKFLKASKVGQNSWSIYDEDNDSFQLVGHARFLNWHTRTSKGVLPWRATLDKIYKADSLDGVHRIIKGKYQFFCNSKLDSKALETFIIAGLAALSMGETGFIERIPSIFKDYIKMVLETSFYQYDRYHVRYFTQHVCIIDEKAFGEVLEKIFIAIVEILRNWKVPTKLLKSGV